MYKFRMQNCRKPRSTRRLSELKRNSNNSVRTKARKQHLKFMNQAQEAGSSPDLSNCDELYRAFTCSTSKSNVGKCDEDSHGESTDSQFTPKRDEGIGWHTSKVVIQPSL